MDTFVVELNQASAEYSKPGEYRVQLSQPIIVNPGDQLSFRMASIDTQKTAQDTIVIERDTALSIKFSYYDKDYSLTDKVGGATKAGPWGGDLCGNPLYDEYFAGYNEEVFVTLDNIIGNINGYYAPGGGEPDYTVPGGSFIVGTYGTGSTVDKSIAFTATFTYVNRSGQGVFLHLSANTAVIVDPILPGWPASYGTLDATTIGLQPNQFELRRLDGTPLSTNPIVYKQGTFKLAGISGIWAGQYTDNTQSSKAYGPYGAHSPANPGEGAAGNTIYDGQYVMDDGQFSFSVNASPYLIITRQLDLQIASAVLKKGRYDPNSLAVKLTQLFSDSNGLRTTSNGNVKLFQPENPLLTRTDTPGNDTLIFRQVPARSQTQPLSFTDLNSYAYWDTSLDTAIPYFIGASTFALEYGQAGPVFQLSYCHTPLNNPSRPSEQDLGIFNYINAYGQQYSVVKSAGGVAIHDMQPESFWQNFVGLRNKLITPLITDASGVYYYTTQNLMRSITEGFAGISTFFLPPTEVSGTNIYPDPRKVTPIPPVVSPIYIDVTGQSKAIIGEQTEQTTTGGYYLIEVLNFTRRQGAYLDQQENRINIAALASTQYLNANSVTVFQDAAIPYQHTGEPYLISEATVRILDPLTKQPAIGLGTNTCVWMEVNKMRGGGPAPPVEQAPTQSEHGQKN